MVAANTADLKTIKLLLSTRGGKHQTIKKILVHSLENTENANAMRIMLRGKYILSQ